MKLTPIELLEISREINRAFAPDFSIKTPEPATQAQLSPQEMCAISEEIRQDFAPKASDRTPELVLLPVDPEHLYAYWNLDDTQQKSAAGPLTLRIYPVSNDKKIGFDVAVAGSRAHKNVLLSMQTQAAAYRATLGKRYSDAGFAPLAYSNIIQVPPGKAQAAQVTDRLPALKTVPTFVTASRKSAGYSASSQGNRL